MEETTHKLLTPSTILRNHKDLIKTLELLEGYLGTVALRQ